MPQLSLYIDEITLKKVEAAARQEHLSISKFVVTKLNESMEKSWPQNFQDLYSSIVDESFAINREKNFKNDIPREDL